MSECAWYVANIDSTVLVVNVILEVSTKTWSKLQLLEIITNLCFNSVRLWKGGGGRLSHFTVLALGGGHSRYNEIMRDNASHGQDCVIWPLMSCEVHVILTKMDVDTNRT